MTKLNDIVCIRRWQACLLIAMSGFAAGNILAKATNSLGM